MRFLDFEVDLAVDLLEVFVVRFEADLLRFAVDLLAAFAVRFDVDFVRLVVDFFRFTADLLRFFLAAGFASGAGATAPDD